MYVVAILLLRSHHTPLRVFSGALESPQLGCKSQKTVCIQAAEPTSPHSGSTMSRRPEVRKKGPLWVPGHRAVATYRVDGASLSSRRHAASARCHLEAIESSFQGGKAASNSLLPARMQEVKPEVRLLCA